MLLSNERKIFKKLKKEEKNSILWLSNKIKLRTFLKDAEVTTRIELIQKSTLLGIARVIRKVLDI